jgi:peroxiredoxin Q/BCP
MGRLLIAALALAAAACSRQPQSAVPEPAVVASAAASPAPADVEVGKPAPEFSATTYDGKVVALSSFRGKPVVVYFYPKDETAGCTKEACSFRDAWEDLAATRAVLIGVSMDNAESHKEFVEHWKLPFVLVSDPDGAIAAKFGVPLKQHGDASFEARQTFVIGPDGVVRKIYREVDVTKHAAEVLADLKP